MDIERVSSIFSQMQALEKSNMKNTEKYRQLYEELKNYGGSMLPSNDDNDRLDMTFENLQDVVSESQVFQIQQQILAYKVLIRSSNIPKDVEKNLFALNKDQWDVEKERLLQRTVKYYHEKVEKNEELKKLISRYNDKKPSQGNMNEESSISQDQEKDGLELKEPEGNYNIVKRKKEIANFVTSSCLTKQAKARLTTESKFLDTVPFYYELRETILKKLVDENPNRALEASLLDRKRHSRERPARKHEHKVIEKFENQMKSEQEARKKVRNKEFIRMIFEHQDRFFEFHKKVNKVMKKRAIGVKAYLEQQEKREQERRERETKIRVQALKDKDFDAYMDLVQKAKNTRILELLKHTDHFLRQIGAKVKVQKGEKPDERDEEITGEGNLAANLKNSNRIYYNVTHSKKEEIPEQPTLLEGGNLKNYQMAGLQWMISLYNNKLNGILADEMGLGKTIQTIALFCYLMEFKHNYGPFLIVVPLTTLSNWMLEFDKWAPSIKKVIYKGSPQNRKQCAITLRTTKWNVCITTYEYILKDRLVLNKFNWQYIIIDEGHRMKNARSKFALTLGQEYNSENRILLTGTPLQNNLGELWSLLNFLLPKVFNSCDEFEKWFSLAVSKDTGDKDTQLSEEEQLLIINRLHQVLRPFLLRRVKKEVEAEIPNKQEDVIKVELSHWQKIVYDQIKDNSAVLKDESGQVAKKSLMNLMMQLRKICDHPYLFLNDNYYINDINDNIFRVSGKFELLDRILPKLFAFKHRVLIFCQMTHVMDIMELYFEHKAFKWLRLDGSTKADERGERVAMFNKPDSEFNIFLLSTRAGGLGLNLQTADTVILFDSDWNPQMDLQAQDRAHRIGAKAEVRVLRLVTNTPIEEGILSKAAFKQSMDDILIQAGMFNEKSTDTERREKLEDLLKKRNPDADSDGEIPDDEQLNEVLARNEEEFKAYEQMDQDRYEREKDIFPGFKYPSKTEEKFHNYRLVTYEEVPDWLKQEAKTEEDKKEYGRGNRARKQVSYVLDMGDDGDLIASDDDNDEDAEIISESSERKTRTAKAQALMKKIESEEEKNKEPEKVLRKRGRPRKVVIENTFSETETDKEKEKEKEKESTDKMEEIKLLNGEKDEKKTPIEVEEPEEEEEEEDDETVVRRTRSSKKLKKNSSVIKGKDSLRRSTRGKNDDSMSEDK